MRSTGLLCILVIIACGSVSALLSEKEYQDAFTAWMFKYQRSYTSSEFQTRYAIFKNNLDYVNEWNSKNTQTILGTNHLADLTNEEYQSIYLGVRPKNLEERIQRDSILPTASILGLPASVDWTKKGAVTPIKNQGQCGSCWSFSATGSTEGIHQIVTGNLVSLSEQNLMDCSTAQGNQGCNGGLMDDAFTYIISNKGIDTEASYPYKAAQGTCEYKAANSGSTLDSFVDVKSKSEADLQAASVNQPISVAIDASHSSFQLYTSGVYYEKACSETALDHGVLLVGYGTDNGVDYYLVKNSWGTTWGQAGYIWMSRNKSNNCGISTMASYPVLKK